MAPSGIKYLKEPVKYVPSPLCHPLPSPEQMINFTGCLMPSLMDLPDMMVSSKACKSGMSNRVATIIRPVAWTAHLWKDRDFIYDAEMTAGGDGSEMAAITMALASETRRGFKGQQERRISILFPKQLLMNLRPREVVFIPKYLISSLWYSTTMPSGDRRLECYSPRQIKNDYQVGLIINRSKELIFGDKMAVAGRRKKSGRCDLHNMRRSSGWICVGFLDEKGQRWGPYECLLRIRLQQTVMQGTKYSTDGRIAHCGNVWQHCDTIISSSRERCGILLIIIGRA